MIKKDLNEQYQAVLRDLQERRASYLTAINELDAMIAGINRQLQVASAEPPLVANQQPIPIAKVANSDETHRFANMSVRWAVLKLLARAGRPMTTGEIAKTLEAGGVESKGQRFSSIVSAVLSDMKSKKGEVESVEDGGFQLTNQGREAWEHIEKSARYRYRDPVASGA